MGNSVFKKCHHDDQEKALEVFQIKETWQLNASLTLDWILYWGCGAAKLFNVFWLVDIYFPFYQCL